MDPSPAQSPSTDLNIVPVPIIVPKIEPKLEIDDVTTTQIGPPNPNPNPLTPEVHTPLQQLPPNEDELFSEYCRLARLFLASSGRGARCAATAGAAIVVSKKKKARSGEMVRVSNLTPQDLLYSRDSVRRARTTYECLRLLLSRDELKKSRVDLKAAALMKDRDLWLNRDKRIIGSIPGINIGDVYFYRMELCVLGLHGQVQAGIDYVTANRSSSGEPIATSIIVSGEYEDDDDNGDELVYTGHGGRMRNMHKHSVSQKLTGGNLALERSMSYGIEIRVIRGLRSDRSPTNKVYVYDGLYKVVKSWVDVGKSGFEVFKYKLVRVEGQEEMGSVLLRRAEELKVNPLSVRPSGYLSLDMSLGNEKFPVALFNDLDEDQDPLLFQYVDRPMYAPGLQEKVFGDCGCECVTNCTSDCYCAKLNGGVLPYDGNGILLKGKPVVYECGTACKCPPSCMNRVSQKGLRNPLEVFRSRETGWGVRSLNLIRAGSFICEFNGIVLTKQQAQILSMNGECLVCPNKFPSRWMEWGDISDVFTDYRPPTLPSLPKPGFSLDVSRARNVACYMSHSCNPNVFVQYVLYDHYTVAYPHIMVFAVENIPPLRELSIDYGMLDEWVGKLTM